jgi:hypothetical protein
MSRYVVRVQLVKWFEIVVNAESPKEALDRAETLKPARICERGKELYAETGLADPESLRLVDEEKEKDG